MQRTYSAQPSFCFPLPDLDDDNTEKIEKDYRVDNLILPVCKCLESNVYMISPETLCDLLKGEYDKYYENLFILDSRYQYEYRGGHIQGALNVTAADLQSLFFDKIVNRSIVIIHCELSKNRGPELASIFRSMDRQMNVDNYPNIYYPDVYILKGGYKKFYRKYPQLCEGGYTKMLDKKHRYNGDLLHETKKFRESSKSSKRSSSLDPSETLRMKRELSFVLPLEKSKSNVSFQSPNSKNCNYNIYN